MVHYYICLVKFGNRVNGTYTPPNVLLVYTRSYLVCTFIPKKKKMHYIFTYNISHNYTCFQKCKYNNNNILYNYNNIQFGPGTN